MSPGWPAFAGHDKLDGTGVRKFACFILLTGSICVTRVHAAPPMELHMQANGLFRFGSGPELNEDQLRKQIQNLMKQNPRPNIQIMSDRMAKYEMVAKVLAVFQKEGYGLHIGFVGIDK
jgi:biopolymer transport protein ExbD